MHVRRRHDEENLIAEIEGVYRRDFGAFVRTATAIVGDAETAYDVVQDAFATAVRQHATFRRDAPLVAWIWRIVVNKARTAQRRSRLSAGADGPTETAPNGFEADSAEAVVRSALAELPERQRLTVFLRYYADLDYDAIAHALGVRPGTVAASLAAAHASLRPRLDEVAR